MHRSLYCRLTPALLVAALCAGCDGTETPAPAPESPQTTTAAVAYEQDDRLDWYEIVDADLATFARNASVAMVPYSDIKYLADGTVTLSAEPTLGDKQDLCADQRFRDQPTSASCSGTLIDDNLVLTAGHCIEDAADCARNAFVFDYLQTDASTRPALGRDQVYRCAALIVDGASDIPGGLDLAIVQLDRPVTGRAPQTPVRPTAEPGDDPLLRSLLQAGDGLMMIGYPSGIPLKLDPSGIVTNPRTTQGDRFTAAIDAFHGNSGSGVFDGAQRLVGVLTSGADDYAALGSCSIVSVLPASDALEGVHYAHHAVTALCAKGFPSVRLCGSGEAVCGDGFCTHDENEEVVIFVGDGVDAPIPTQCPGDCTGLFLIPDSWSCSSRWYDAGDDCDCNCGAVDPDCGDTTLDVYNCAPGATCSAEGTCSATVPDEWTCRRSWYGAGDDCDCRCGAYDPDCDNPELRILNCSVGATCQEDGWCTEGAPPEWTCLARDWGRGNGCHCGCGAVDPDCATAGIGAPVIGCVPGSVCLADGSCRTPIPETWVCPIANFGADGRCDCNCGAADPDCEASLDRPRNCRAGEVCDDGGLCVDAPDNPEPGPDAPPETAPEAASDRAPEPMPEAQPEIAPEPMPEAQPETAPEPMPEGQPEPIVEPQPEPMPEPIVEAQPESVPEAAPEPAPEPGPEPKPEAAPEAADDDLVGPSTDADGALPGRIVAGGGACRGGSPGEGAWALLAAVLILALRRRGRATRQARGAR